MPKKKHRKLTEAYVKVAPPGWYYDRDGLILRVTATGSRSWIWTGTVRSDHGRGRRVRRGMGSARFKTLREAREEAFEWTRNARRGIDPGGGADTSPSFGDMFEGLVRDRRAIWKNGSTEKRWRQQVNDHAGALLFRPVASIETADVLSLLRPIWRNTHETAKRVRTMLSMVFQRAIGEGHRTDDPAGEHILKNLPSVANGRVHHPALPHAEAGRAILNARATGQVPHALVFEACLLSGCRSQEVTGARWDEVSDGVWTIPPARMKANREHRVPVTAALMDVFGRAREVSGGSPFIFPSAKGTPLSAAVMSKFMRKLALPSDTPGRSATLHGLRSTMRNWMAENGVPRETAERVLAHKVRSSVEASYNRTDLLSARREAMAAWADYIG